MKKFLIVLVVFLLILTISPTFAFAQSKESEIAKLVQQNDKISKAQCVIYQRYCVVAIKTTQFAAKSDYTALKKQLEKEIADQFDFDKVIITRNPKVMHEIQLLNDLPEAERQAEIEKLVENLIKFGNRPPRIKFS